MPAFSISHARTALSRVLGLLISGCIVGGHASANPPPTPDGFRWGTPPQLSFPLLNGYSAQTVALPWATASDSENENKLIIKLPGDRDEAVKRLPLDLAI